MRTDTESEEPNESHNSMQTKSHQHVFISIVSQRQRAGWDIRVKKVKDKRKTSEDKTNFFF
jgi:hypothetical protein